MNLTNIDFQDKIENGISLVKFNAGWCGPCKRYAPIFDKFSENNPNINCYSVDCDNEIALAEEYSIMSIPVTLLFKDGELIEKKQGILTEEQLSDLIKSCE